MATGGFRVEGLADLQRAFKQADRDVRLRMKHTLQQVAEPVRADAQQLAMDNLRPGRIPWFEMRTGVTLKAVYVAPRQRGLRQKGPRSRPKFAPYLMRKALEPALQRNTIATYAAVNQMLNGVAADWERM